MYKTPYRYRFSLDKDIVDKEDNKYVVYYYGKKELIENSNCEIGLQEQLTINEFLEIFEGTKGIINIEGNFVPDNDDDGN